MFHRVSSVAIAAVLTLASPALATPPSSPMASGEDAERHMDHLFERLHLTADQRAKMQEIRKRHMEATADVRKRLMDRRKALFTLVRGVDAKKEQALALQREINALQAQLAEARLAAWFEGRSVLTREQLQALAALPGGPPRHHP